MRATPNSDERALRRFQDHPDRGYEDRLEHRAIVRAKQGDWDAVTFLYLRYAKEVENYVASIVRNSHDAEDVTQGVFARLLSAIARYEQREVAFSAWLMRVARNAALDHLRAKRQLPAEEIRVDDAGEDQMNAERRQALREALDRLPEDQRKVLVMRHVVGLSPGEIAKRLGRSEGSVHGLHHRGRGALQGFLDELEAAPVVSAQSVP